VEIQIKKDTYEIRRADMNDLKDVLDLLINAAGWLKSKETTQWDYYMTNLEENTEEVSDSIQNGCTYLILHEDRPVAFDRMNGISISG
jgi:hypothetical protein